MRIRKFQIKNYKSILDSGEVDLSPSFNVIVGKNDSGKSAVLESLSLAFVSRPHRSLKSVRFFSAPADLSSSISLEIAFTMEDVSNILCGAQFLSIKLPSGATLEQSVQRAENVLKRGGTLKATFDPNVGFKDVALDGLSPGNSSAFLVFRNLGYPQEFQPVYVEVDSGVRTSTEDSLLNNLRNSIYAFKAERLNIGESAAQGNSHLHPNAQNLAEVLNHLISSDPRLFDRLIRHIQTVFPHITQVTSSLIPGGSTARISVWSIPPDSGRSDLAIPLSESGTGIGQVLAILYVVVTSAAGKILLIDEPQSFLHPGAVRKLFEILRGYPQHQYVVTTHAPLAMTGDSNDQMLITRRHEQETSIQKLDPSKTEDLRSFLSEVGARLGDVFGADSILWVEGRTEERCFPEILKRIAKMPLGGTQILGIVNTGDLEGKHAETMFSMYDRVSGGSTLLPPAIAFILDTEGKTKGQRDDIDRHRKGLVTWLPMRMYENYLIDPGAIAQVLTDEIPDLGEIPELTARIQQWLAAEAGAKKYFPDSDAVALNDANWRKSVHGAKILSDIFSDLSAARLRYDKVKHGHKLTLILLKDPSEELIDLSRLLERLIATPI